MTELLLASPPLQGKTVLVTRAAGQSSQFTALLKAQGAAVVELPTLAIAPPSSWQALDEAIADLDRFDWLILTSTNGVDYFLERLGAQGKQLCGLANLRIAVVGQKTAVRLQQRGVEPDFIPPDFVADSLVEHFPESERLNGMQILFPRVETGGREVLVNQLSARGAVVVEVAAYQSDCAGAIAPEVAKALAQGKIDVITFASSKTVKCFQRLIQPLGLPASICIASIGPQTSVTCEQLLGRVDVEAKEYTLEGLTQAIVEWAASVSGSGAMSGSID